LITLELAAGTHMEAGPASTRPFSIICFQLWVRQWSESSCREWHKRLVFSSQWQRVQDAYGHVSDIIWLSIVHCHA